MGQSGACCQLREGAQPLKRLLPPPLLLPCLPPGGLLLPCPAAREGRAAEGVEGAAAWPPWALGTRVGEGGEVEAEEEEGPELPVPPPASSAAQKKQQGARADVSASQPPESSALWCCAGAAGLDTVFCCNTDVGSLPCETDASSTTLLC